MIRKYLAFAVLTVMTQLNFMPYLLADDQEVLVKNAWAEVTKSDFYLELSRLPEQYRGGIEVSGKRVVELIDTILTRKSLAAQARELDIDSEPEIQKKIEWLIDKMLSQTRIDRLEQGAITDFESRIEFFRKRADEVYAAGKDSDEFKTPVVFDASHILVDMVNRTRGEAAIRINEVRDKVLAGGSFEELALEYSDDPSSEQNKGRLGQFGPGQMVKPFEDATYKLEKAGDISAIVETSYGLHVIKLNGRVGGAPMTLEQAKPGIIDGLRSDYVKRVRIKHMQALDTDETMTIDEKAIDSLVIPAAAI